MKSASNWIAAALVVIALVVGVPALLSGGAWRSDVRALPERPALGEPPVGVVAEHVGPSDLLVELGRIERGIDRLEARVRTRGGER